MKRSGSATVLNTRVIEHKSCRGKNEVDEDEGNGEFTDPRAAASVRRRVGFHPASAAGAPATGPHKVGPPRRRVCAPISEDSIFGG